MTYRHSDIVCIDKDTKDINTKLNLNLNKLLLVMAFIKLNINRRNLLYISINELVRGIGYVPNTRAKRINEIVIYQLQWLETNNYIFIDCGKISFDKLNSNDCFKISINTEHDIFDMIKTDDKGNYVKKKFPVKDSNNPADIYEYNKFVMLEDYEFDAITKSETRLDNKDLNSILVKINNDIFEKNKELPTDKKIKLLETKDDLVKSIKTDKGIMLRVFLNIKKHINMDTVDPCVCFAPHKTLCDNCDISTTGTINNAIQDLVKLGILFVYETGSYLDNNKKPVNMVNYYAVDKKQLDEQYCINCAKQWLKDNRGIDVDHFNPVVKPNTNARKKTKITKAPESELVAVVDDIPKMIPKSIKLTEQIIQDEGHEDEMFETEHASSCDNSYMPGETKQEHDERIAKAWGMTVDEYYDLCS